MSKENEYSTLWWKEEKVPISRETLGNENVESKKLCEYVVQIWLRQKFWKHWGGKII